MVYWVATGTLLFVLLIGASYSYPTKKGSDSGSQGGGSGGAQQDVIYSKPSDFRGAEGSLGVGAAPVYSGYAASYPTASMPQNLGPAASQDVDWLSKPRGPLYDGSEPGAGRTMLSPGMGQSHGSHSHASPADSPSSLYQPGELSHMQNTYEHGNYDTERETQGLPVQQSGGLLNEGPIEPDGGIGGLSFNPGPFNPYPYHDLRFLFGHYPPGTVSHFSSDFEQGRDYFHDAHYNKYHPGDPTGPDDDDDGGDDDDEQQVKQFPKIKPRQQGDSTPQA